MVYWRILEGILKNPKRDLLYLFGLFGPKRFLWLDLGNEEPIKASKSVFSVGDNLFFKSKLSFPNKLADSLGIKILKL